MSRSSPLRRRGRARLEVAVVQAVAQPVVEALGGRRAMRAAQPVDAPRRRSNRSPTSVLDRLAGLAQRARRGVDRQRRLVAEQVADHRRQHERRAPDRPPARRSSTSAGKRSSPSSATTIGVALWARKIATSLATSSAVAAGQAGRAHEDQRLGRQVDVLLVLGDVAGDRLVAELAELDPHLLGGDLVGAVADDRPVALGRARTGGRPRRSSRGGRAPRASRRASRAATASRS